MHKQIFSAILTGNIMTPEAKSSPPAKPPSVTGRMRNFPHSSQATPTTATARSPTITPGSYGKKRLKSSSGATPPMTPSLTAPADLQFCPLHPGRSRQVTAKAH